MVFLRPRVVHNPKEADNLLDEINQHSPKVKQWEQDTAPKQDPKSKKP